MNSSLPHPTPTPISLKLLVGQMGSCTRNSETSSSPSPCIRVSEVVWKHGSGEENVEHLNCGLEDLLQVELGDSTQADVLK